MALDGPREASTTISRVSIAPSLARRAWTMFEPIHAIVYFAPEAVDLYKAAGLRGGWMGYFASRSAPMGAVTAPVVIATFHSFRPSMVERAIPDAWEYSSPERALEARLAVADTVLRRLWGSLVESAEVAETAAAAMEVARNLRGDGRPIYLAHAALDVPDAPHLALWHACTLFREHRFDGHVAALTAHDIDGLEALVTAVASKPELEAPLMRSYRGWTEEEWEDAAQRLRRRGILDAGNALTDEGHAVRSSVEDMTDRLAGDVWDALDEWPRERLFDGMRRLAILLEGTGGIIYPNPIGVPRPV